MAELTLRDYQTDCCDAIDKAYADGQRYCLVHLPTAAGKTVMFTETIWRRGAPALVIAHREELLDQATEKLIATGIDPRIIGRVMAGDNQHDKAVVVASVQTLARQSRRLPLQHRAWATIVIDEAHHAPAESYQRILADLVGPDTLVLGVTATPDRQGMDDIWGPPVYSRTILEMIDEGWLSELRAKRIDLDMSFRDMRKSAGDWRADDLAGAILKADGPAIVVQRWMEEAENRQTLVFTPTVDVAHAVAAAFQHEGIDAEAIDGTTAASERAGLVERFKSGETKVLCNCALFTEGVDLPSCACVVIARPTLSPLLYAQMLGRGLRKHPGKDDCLILDLAGASKRHTLDKLKQADGPVTVDAIIGLPVGPDGIQRGNPERDNQVQALLDQVKHVRMIEVDPFGRDHERGPAFLRVGDRGLMLPCHDGRSFVVEGVTVWRFGTAGEPARTWTASSHEGALQMAASLARGYGRSPRKKGEPTDNQVNYLLSLRPELKREAVLQLTSAQVSDAIDQHRTERKWHQWKAMRGLTTAAR